MWLCADAHTCRYAGACRHAARSTIHTGARVNTCERSASRTRTSASPWSCRRCCSSRGPRALCVCSARATHAWQRKPPVWNIRAVIPVLPTLAPQQPTPLTPLMPPTTPYYPNAHIPAHPHTRTHANTHTHTPTRARLRPTSHVPRPTPHTPRPTHLCAVHELWRFQHQGSGGEGAFGFVLVFLYYFSRGENGGSGYGNRLRAGGRRAGGFGRVRPGPLLAQRCGRASTVGSWAFVGHQHIIG